MKYIVYRDGDEGGFVSADFRYFWTPNVCEAREFDSVEEARQKTAGFISPYHTLTILQKVS